MTSASVLATTYFVFNFKAIMGYVMYLVVTIPYIILSLCLCMRSVLRFSLNPDRELGLEDSNLEQSQFQTNLIHRGNCMIN